MTPSELLEVIDESIRRKYCISTYCTTCACHEFFEAIAGKLQVARQGPGMVRLSRAQALEIVDALAGMAEPKNPLSGRNNAVMVLILRLWWAVPELRNSFSLRLQGSWAGSILASMVAHSKYVALEKKRFEEGLVRQRLERRAQHAAAIEARRLQKMEIDRRWYAGHPRSS